MRMNLINLDSVSNKKISDTTCWNLILSRTQIKRVESLLFDKEHKKVKIHINYKW